jgi:hypothetical protein
MLLSPITIDFAFPPCFYAHEYSLFMHTFINTITQENYKDNKKKMVESPKLVKCIEIALILRTQD